MQNIKQFVISNTEPSPNDGWLKPADNGKYDMYLHGPNGWEKPANYTPPPQGLG